jgi:release factor glutamine methyltransferase
MKPLRRLTHPILLQLYLRRAANRVLTTKVGGFRLRVFPSVFHPKYFGSSLILGRYVESLDVSGKAFLDMGTGSGIVGLFAARAGALVTATDVNPEAVRCAADNAAAARFNIECIESDLFGELLDRRFDYIAWNPPFFPKPAGTAAEAALYAGHGYSVIARFAQDCRAHLGPEGRLVLVLSFDIDVAAVELLFRAEGYSVRRTVTEKWGLRETMVVIDIR